jgi:hypothetical protein
VDLRYPDAHASLEPLRKTCDWLVANQSADGSWGDFSGPDDVANPHLLRFSASGDAQRSPRVLSLLQWCSERLSPHDPKHAAAANNFVAFLMQARARARRRPAPAPPASLTMVGRSRRSLPSRPPSG